MPPGTRRASSARPTGRRARCSSARRAAGAGDVPCAATLRDWARPGSGAIYSNVVGNTRPGSIILSHDAGGPREQTVAAYRSIIPTLKRRGYRFATVPELLGLKPTYA